MKTRTRDSVHSVLASGAPPEGRRRGLARTLVGTLVGTLSSQGCAHCRKHVCIWLLVKMQNSKSAVQAA